MRLPPTILLALGLFASPAFGTDAITLQELEQKIEAAPAVRLAEAERLAAESRQELAVAAAAPRLFATASAGRFADPARTEQYAVQTIAPDGSASFATQRMTPEALAHTRYGAQVGIRMPLFGSRELVLREIDSAKAEVGLQRLKEELYRMEALKALRYAYVDAWFRPRQERLAQAYLGGKQQADEVLRLRAAAHLLLDAERRDIETGWLAARKQALDAAAVGLDALRRLEILSGVPLRQAHLAPPRLSVDCASRAKLEKAVDSHPDIRFHAAQLEHRRRLLATAGASVVEGGVSLSHGRVREPGGGSGHSTAVALEVAIPLSADRYRRAQRGQASAEVTRAQLLLDSRRQDYLSSLARLFDELETRDAELLLARQRLAASREAHRVAAERLAGLDGEPVTTLLRARLAVYAAATELLSAQAALARAQADVLGYGISCPPAAEEDGDEAEAQALALLGAPLPGFAPSGDQAPGWYAWKAFSRYELDPAGFWASMPPASRILLSLSGDELDAVRGDGRRATRLQELLEGAAVRAIRVELLLGDPDWALPAKSTDLLALVRSLAAFRFGGLHLDLERMQLPEPKRDAWADGVVALVEKLKFDTGLPLALSLHPRDASIPGLLPRLQAAGLDEVTFMAYVANPARVAELVTPVLARYPGLRFSIAQSIEPQLAEGGSYAGAGASARNAAFADLTARMKEAPNFAGIIVQSLEDHAWSAP